MASILISNSFLKNCKKSNFQKKVCVEMKHKKNEPEHPLHFSKYNSPPRTRKRAIALLHILPSLFFQLEQQPLKPLPLSQGQALLAHFLFLRGIKLVSPGPYPLLSPLLGMFFPSHSSAGAFAPFWFQLKCPLPRNGLFGVPIGVHPFISHSAVTFSPS